jgi:transposase InsO family protein
MDPSRLAAAAWAYPKAGGQAGGNSNAVLSAVDAFHQQALGQQPTAGHQRGHRCDPPLTLKEKRPAPSRARQSLYSTPINTAASCAHGHAAVIAVDRCSAECVGIHAARRATRCEVLEPIRQGVRRHFGGFAGKIAAGLLRYDHGSLHMADPFQNELALLGVESLPAFVRAPEGNGCAERFIRMLKETSSGSGPSPSPRNSASRSSPSARPTTPPTDRAPRLQTARRLPPRAASTRGCHGPAVIWPLV